MRDTEERDKLIELAARVQELLKGKSTLNWVAEKLKEVERVVPELRKDTRK